MIGFDLHVDPRQQPILEALYLVLPSCSNRKQPFTDMCISLERHLHLSINVLSEYNSQLMPGQQFLPPKSRSILQMLNQINHFTKY